MASTDEEIRVAITAQADQFNAAMTEAGVSAEGLAAQLKAANTDILAQGAALTRLDAAFAGPINTSKQLADAEAALDAAMITGAISAKQQAEYLEKLSASQAAVAETAQLAAGATEELATAQTITGGTARELGVLIGELARGNYTRLEGSTITLANRTGLLSKALQFLLSPAGLAMEAAAATGIAVFESAEHFDRFQQTVLSTGNIMGSSAGQLQHMADDVGLMTGHTFEAVDAVEKLGASGRFTADELEQASRAAVNFSTVTGTQIGKAVEVITKLKEKPKQAIVELNDQYHVLTESQATLIEKMMATGQSAQAAAVFMNAFDQAMMQRKDEEEAHAGALARGWHSVSNWIQQAAEHEAEYIEVANGGGDTAEKLAVAQRKMALDTQLMTHWWNRMGSVISGINQDQVQQDREQVSQLQQKLQTENQIAQAKAKQSQAVAQGIDHALGGKGGKGGGGAGDETAFQQAQYEAQLQGHEMSLAEQRTWWQQRLAQDKQGGDGEAQEAQSAMRHLVTIQKEMDRQTEEAAKTSTRKKAQAEAEASRAVVSNFETQRTEAQAASLERIQIDTQMMGRIARLYGQNSEQYRRALQERLSDTKAYVEQVRSITDKASRDEKANNLQSLQNDHQLATQRLSIKKQEYQLEYQQRRITADQLMQLEKALAAEKLKIDQNHYSAKAALDKGDVKAYDQDLYQLKAAKLRYDSDLLTAESSVQSKLQASWKSTANQISGAFRTGLNSIIFQGETTKKAMASIAESIAESIINTAVEHPKEVWLAAEALKKGVSLSTVLGITSANATGAATDIATDKTKTAALLADAVALAGAQGVASFAAAPWPVDMGAPAFGASMAAVAAGFGSVASAAGGWDRVPVDDAPALLHRNEMVLPANLADRVRGMTDQVGGGGDTHHHHYNFHMQDSRGLQDFIRRHGNTLTESMSRLARRGHRF